MNRNRNSQKQSGQAAMEYILLLLVVVSVSYGAYLQMEEGLFGSNGFFESYRQKAQQVFSAGSGANLEYKRYSLRR